MLTCCISMNTTMISATEYRTVGIWNLYYCERVGSARHRQTTGLDEPGDTHSASAGRPADDGLFILYILRYGIYSSFRMYNYNEYNIRAIPVSLAI